MENLVELKKEELQEIEGGSILGCLVVGMAIGALAVRFVKGMNDAIREWTS